MYGNKENIGLPYVTYGVLDFNVLLVSSIDVMALPSTPLIDFHEYSFSLLQCTVLMYCFLFICLFLEMDEEKPRVETQETFDEEENGKILTEE